MGWDVGRFQHLAEILHGWEILKNENLYKECSHNRCGKTLQTKNYPKMYKVENIETIVNVQNLEK